MECRGPFLSSCLICCLGNLKPNDPSSSIQYTLDAVMMSGILKVKQKLGVTFNFDKQDVIDLAKFSKMTMCRASEANA